MSSSISPRQFEIIEAAGKLLSIAGVSGLTIKNLAKEMGFSESAIYRHFPSKEAIILSLLSYLAKNMDERLQAIVQDEQDALASFQAVFRHQFQFFSQRPHFVVAVFSDGLMEASQGINIAILHIMQVKQRHLQTLVEAGQKQGYFTQSLDSEALVKIIMGAFRLQMYKWRASSFQFDLQEEGERLLHSILLLIRLV